MITKHGDGENLQGNVEGREIIILKVIYTEMDQ
jgi:hypothetical protein